MKTSDFAKAWTIARRDLRGRFVGLRLLIVCLLLGVATLAAIGSLTNAITEELANRGQAILGGDLEIAVAQREATAAELAALKQTGTLSETLRMQAMARLPDGSDTQLVELKGVDAAYPLYGKFSLESGDAVSAPNPGDIYVTPALMQRLSLAIGDKIAFGEASFTVSGVIADEPDRLSEGLSLGPVAITSLASLRTTQLIQPGSLFESKYRLKLPEASDPGAVGDKLSEQFPNSAWEIKTRDDGAPSTRRFIERMGQFLTLVGLASLVIAGIGVGNGVASYLRGKQGAIATLKILGADSAMIFRIYLFQIMAVAVGAIALGLAIGALAPLAIIKIAGDVLPIKPEFAIYPLPLLVSALYGLLIAVIFALPPLSRAKTIPAAGIIRGEGGSWRQIDRQSLTGVGLAIAAIVALALGTANEPLFSASFIGAAAAILLLLTGLGALIRWLASKAPRPKHPLLRLALTSLHRPGAQTGQLVVALGLGLTLFATLAAIQTSLTNEIRSTVPRDAPSFFVLDIPVERADDFRAKVAETASDAEINIVPTLRGTITEFGGQRVSELETLPEGAWVLRGDRGLTYSATIPEGSEVVEGKWWSADYDGPPLVSVDQEQGAALGLKVGDSLTVSLLGVEIPAKVASFRKVNWRNFGFNYVLVFPPSVLANVPHNVAATIQLDTAKEDTLLSILPQQFPSISMVKVKEIAAQIGDILDQMATAIAAAASIAFFSGIAVLIGAIAASRQARVYDSVILKLLGATRSQILTVQAVEYALLAFLLSLVALGLGLFAGWFVITQIFEFTWQPDWGIVLLTLGIGAVATLGIGLLGSIPVLSAKPARALREL
ncbi:MAG: FtsX-like permease family protein [Sphingomonadales bacterium]|nr:FtsX-like permease family protein [Sphingomonadales bacterium]NCO50052.1 FtsX-like permease family protein [Sphingomonadales bacterium]NCO99971.1 FtsX-like permease family protein [Sphingomonadales bacterium]NCP25425.1 FtsX-like permease family protein [Sphingomonadales bacterium]NCP44157.1 FtsX-like permease family protein [Sphingomonadales bacterium]